MPSPGFSVRALPEPVLLLADEVVLLVVALEPVLDAGTAAPGLLPAVVVELVFVAVDLLEAVVAGAVVVLVLVVADVVVELLFVGGTRGSTCSTKQIKKKIIN